MHLRSISLIFSLTTLAGLCRPVAPSSSLAEQVTTRACRYLWDQQAEDGGWHSKTHGLLQGGQAWTPFVLFTLLNAPEAVCPRPVGRIERGLDFIRRHINPEGVLGWADLDVVEYPNYATAYALRVLVQIGDAADEDLIRRMTDYLVGQQFVEHRGIKPDHPGYGAWGFGEQGLPFGQTGHVDLSHTRRVLQALREAGHHDAETYRKAQMSLSWLQKKPEDARLQAVGLDSTCFDGGFFSSAVVPGVNKSAPVLLPNVFESYATTTADGVLALLAAGVSPEDHRVQTGLNWLLAHSKLTHPEGMKPNDPNQWERVLFYYHLAIRAEVYRTLEHIDPSLPALDWEGEMVMLLEEKQASDGSFSNPYGAANKEDDPILATALVVQVLRGGSE